MNNVGSGNPGHILHINLLVKAPSLAQETIDIPRHLIFRILRWNNTGVVVYLVQPSLILPFTDEIGVPFKQMVNERTLFQNLL